MEFIIKIKNCNDCKYLAHTGNFTKGGAKPCCNHPVTCEEKGNDCFKRVIPYRMKPYGLYWRDYAVVKKIPNWCPLKKLKEY